MRILHARDNIAGQATVISRAQRILGYKSDVLVYEQQVFKYECDFNLDLDHKTLLSRFFSVLKMFISVILYYDIIHFHYGRTLFPWNLDLLILKLFRKRSIMHYWGSDIIQIDIAKAYTLLDENTLYDIYPLRNDGDIRKKIAKFEKFIDLSIVGDYSLLPYSIHSIVIRQAVDINNIPFVGCNEGKIQLKIVHAPTNRKIKGTAFVIDAVEQLKKQGYNIELIIVENRPHHEAMDIFKEADIVVDDLLQGPYGIFAIECMALGKPVLGRIDPKLIHNYPDLPIVNADPKNIYQKLIELIENTTLRRDIGLKGRIYVEKNHDHLLIATKILNLYHQL